MQNDLITDSTMLLHA